MSSISNHPRTKAFIEGTEIMCVQAPLVHAFGRISVVSCLENLPAIEATKRIFSGAVDGKTKRSIRHCAVGAGGHFGKEIARLGIKVGGLILKPELDLYCKKTGYSQRTANLLFSLGLSIGEFFVNPLDVIRTMWMAGKKISHIPQGQLFARLFEGAGLNSVRQFVTWYSYTSLNDFWSRTVEYCTPLSASSFSGIVLKSLPQSFQVTSGAWFYERLKNELQYRLGAQQRRKGLSFRSGIQFKSYGPLLKDPVAFKRMIRLFADRYRGMEIDAIAGLDARGFVFGTALAYELNLPFVMVRKAGKLPGDVERIDYALEYGKSTLELERSSLKAGERVLVVDDLMATGGTAKAACDLIERLGAVVTEVACMIELTPLGGREKVGHPVFSLITIYVDE